MGILPDKLRFIFDGKQLEDTLADCKIRENTSLHLVLRLGSCMHISVKTSKGIITLEVYPTSSIANVKQQLKDLFPPNQQRLVFNGKQVKDSHTLSDYNIENGSTIHLNLSLAYMQVIVAIHTGRKYSVTVLQDESVENFKQIIADRIGIPPDEQRLIFAGSQAGRAQSRLRIWSGDTSTHYLLRWNAVVIIINRKWLLNMRVHGREITHTLCCRQWR